MPAPMMMGGLASDVASQPADADADPDRFGQRAAAQRHAVGQFVGYEGRRADVFGEGTGPVCTDQSPFRTKLGKPHAAGAALFAVGKGVDRHGVVDTEFGHVASHFHDLAGKLMAHNQRRRTQCIVAQKSAQLRAAMPAKATRITTSSAWEGSGALASIFSGGPDKRCNSFSTNVLRRV